MRIPDAALKKPCRRCYRNIADKDGTCIPCNGNDKSTILPNWMNFWQVDGACQKCTYPLHIASGQDVHFCPNCAAEKKHLDNAHKRLEALKKRVAQGDFIPVKAKTNDDGFFIKGMAL